jgi:hypothetical protein
VIAVKEHRSLMDATGQRQGQDASQSPREQPDRLAGVAEDELRLGVGTWIMHSA